MKLVCGEYVENYKSVELYMTIVAKYTNNLSEYTEILNEKNTKSYDEETRAIMKMKKSSNTKKYRVIMNKKFIIPDDNLYLQIH